MELVKKILPVFAVLAIIMANLIAFYRPALEDPMHTHLNNSGDAFKNYFTPVYHVEHDEGYLWFDGMNYPYGEHVVFADAQPLLSNSLKFVHEHIFDLSGKVMGIMNLLMLFSFFPGAYFLYLIFRKLKLPPLPASLFASVIILLSPQVLRFPGHYALAYVCFVPMLIWFLWLAMEKRDWKWSMSIGIFLFFWGLIQPYYIMLGVFLGAATWFMTLVLHWKDEKFLRAALHFGLQCLLPLITFKLFLSATDPVMDRPSVPYGFFDYHARWESVFLPINFPHSKPINALSTLLTGGPIRKVSWEGVAYVGLPASFLALFFFGRFFFQIVRGAIKKQWKYIKRPTPHTQFNVFLYASLLIFLFSCTFPFVWKLKALVQYIPYLNQFRSIGRFAWIFFYVWTIYLGYFTWLNVRKWEIKRGWRKIMGYAVLIVVLGFYAYEGLYWNHLVTNNKLTQEEFPSIAEIPENVPELSWLGEIDTEKYAAISVLPYYHEGSENINMRALKSVSPSFQTALYTGLPLTNVMMSRTSLNQTLAQIQLQKEEYSPLKLMEDWKSEKGLLVVWLKKVKIPVNQQLLKRGDLLYEDEFAEVRSLEKADLLNWGNDAQSMIERAIQSIPEGDSLVSIGEGLYSNIPEDVLKIDMRDDSTSEHVFRGSGADQEKSTLNMYFHRGPVPSAEPGDTLVLSAWLWVGAEGHPKHYFGTELHVPGNPEPKFWNYNSSNEFIKAFSGDWALVEKEIPIDNPQDSLTVNFTQWKRRPPFVYVDEFLMRKKGADVFGLRPGPDGPEFYWNNRRYSLPAGMNETSILLQLQAAGRESVLTNSSPVK